MRRGVYRHAHRQVQRRPHVLPTGSFTNREVVTVGSWSSSVVFDAGDCLLITADGTGKNNPNIRVNINLTPQ